MNNTHVDKVHLGHGRAQRVFLQILEGLELLGQELRSLHGLHVLGLLRELRSLFGLVIQLRSFGQP